MKNNLLLIIIGIMLSNNSYSQSCSCYVTVDSTYQLAPMSLGTDTGGAPHYWCNSCSSLPIALPFKFCFYGKYFDTVYINNKGSLTFINPDFTFSHTGFPIANIPMLAVFYADIDNRPYNAVTSLIDNAAIYYKVSPTHLIVQWNLVGYSTLDDDLYNNFQITLTNGNDSILPSGNNIAFCYEEMQWASADSSGGSAGFDGIPATVAINKGDGVNYAQLGAFDFPGYTYEGPLDTAGELYWLNNKSFVFNTCVPGNQIPPVLINPDLCDTLSICAGDTALFPYSFLCAQTGQIATISATSPGLSGLTTDVSVSKSIYYSSTQLVAALKDTGTHTITITATDNNSPPLTNSVSFKVFIENCDSTTGISEIINNLDFNIYPNPNNGVFTLKMENTRYALQHNKTKVDIYNTLGLKVYTLLSATSSSYLIDLSTQPSGLYFYHIYNETGNISANGKFIIQH